MISKEKIYWEIEASSEESNIKERATRCPTREPPWTVSTAGRGDWSSEAGLKWRFLIYNLFIEINILKNSFKFDIYLIMISFSKYLLNMYVPGTTNSKK